MQVPQPEFQHKVMIEAVENHMPQVIIIDEIGTKPEAAAARTIAQRGVQLIATAHGEILENVIQNPSLNDLIGGVQTVILGDDAVRERGGKKSVIERKEPPTFDVVVELSKRHEWRVHRDVSGAVDLLLGKKSTYVEMEIRRLLEDGTVQITTAAFNADKNLSQS